MTTALPQTHTPPPDEAAYGAATSEAEVGCFYIPLVEFGQSLDSLDLDEWLEAFAARNKHFSGGFFEITAQGELKIMPPTGLPGSLFENELATDTTIWARTYGGKVQGPTGRFLLPNGSRPGPDVSWISDERWNAMAPSGDLPTFAPIAPDFICEIVSPSNRGPELVGKVELFIANGTRLAWVINPERRLVTIYRPGQDPETLVDPETLDGEDVLPGFVFEVRARIFDNAG